VFLAAPSPKDESDESTTAASSSYEMIESIIKTIGLRIFQDRITLHFDCFNQTRDRFEH